MNLGYLLYQMITGNTPFLATTIPELTYRVTSGQKTPIPAVVHQN
jgi:hypothetical protein